MGWFHIPTREEFDRHRAEHLELESMPPLDHAYRKVGGPSRASSSTDAIEHIAETEGPDITSSNQGGVFQTPRLIWEEGCTYCWFWSFLLLFLCSNGAEQVEEPLLTALVREIWNLNRPRSRARKGSNQLLLCLVGYLANNRNNNLSPYNKNQHNNNNNNNRNNNSNNNNHSKSSTSRPCLHWPGLQRPHPSPSRSQTLRPGLDKKVADRVSPWQMLTAWNARPSSKDASIICVLLLMHWRLPFLCTSGKSNRTMSLLKVWLRPAPWRWQ